MQDRAVTGELLEYYSELSVHHRLMMIGFATVYFGINQLLILTPQDTLTNVSQRFPLAIVTSGGLLTVFVLAAMLHHACHFCSTAAMKAVMATEAHYQHLPDSVEDLDTFQRWSLKTAKDIRTFLAVPTASAYIVCALFALLAMTNAYLFVEISRGLLAQGTTDTAYLFGGFIFLQLSLAVYYLTIFFKHLRYLRLAKRELAMVMKAATRDQFDSHVRSMSGLPSSRLGAAFTLDQDD